MKVWTDASCDDRNYVFGVGYVIELETGARITGKNYVEGEYSSMEAEWYGLMEGLQIAEENITEFDDEVEVIVDCQPLVDKIREPNDMYDDRWHRYRKAALKQLFTFEEWDLRWEERAGSDEEHPNYTANRLAREAMWEGRGDDGVVGGNATDGITFNDTT